LNLTSLRIEPIPMQRTLSDDQVAASYHDAFVEDQTRHFMSLTANSSSSGTVVDVGGGRGFFAQRLRHLTGRRLRAVDMDAKSVAVCHKAGLDAHVGGALASVMAGDENAVCFNLILHHLIGSSEAVTRRLRRQAMVVWQGHANHVFVNEHIYESFLGNLSGWLIYQITKSRLLSAIGRAVARWVPVLKASTFAVGVRFRAHQEWVGLFADAGYAVKRVILGQPERVPLPLRLPLIREIRRDSFLLSPSPPR